MPFSNQTSSKLSSRQQLTNAGKMFVVTNPTPGTAVTHATLTAYSATANGLFVIQNNNAANTGTNIYLDQLRLCQTAAAPASTLVKRFEIVSETGLVTGTGNVATRTPINRNPGVANTTGAVVQSFSAGAITIPAAVGTRRIMDILAMPTGVTVRYDAFNITFGGETAWKNGGAAARATDPAEISISAAAVCITPQTTTWINMWWVTQDTNIPQYEFSLTYAELQEDTDI